MSLSLVTPPVDTPLILDDVKAHLRVLSTDEDTLIQALMDTAFDMLDGRDGILGRALITQTWDYYLDSFLVDKDGHTQKYHHYYDVRLSSSLPMLNFLNSAHPIKIPLSPLQSVTSVTYIDENGDTQTLDPSLYTVDTISIPSRIMPAFDQVWPTTQWVMNAVKIRGVFGFGDNASDIPGRIKAAMLLIIGHLYENREQTTPLNLSTLPNGVSALLASYRVAYF